MLCASLVSAQWTKLAGSGAGGQEITVTKEGNVYIAGIFSGNPDFGDTVLSSNANNVFVVKYDSVGIFQWIKTMRAGNIYGPKMDVDDLGNVYLGAAFDDTLFIETDTLIGSSGPTLKHKPFVVKYNSNGIMQWINTPEMNSVDGDFYPGDIKVSLSGDVYYSGICDPTFFPWCDTLTFGNDTLYGSFFVKYNPNGNVLWVQGVEVDHIAFDKMGYYYTTNLYLTQTTIRKYNANDSLVWQDTLSDIVTDLDVDSIGNIYVGFNDFTVNKYDSNGTFLWQVPLSAVILYDIAADNEGNVIVAYRYNNIGTYVEKYDPSGNYLGQIQLGIRVDSAASVPYVAGLYLDNFGFIYSTGSCFAASPLIFGDDTLTGHGGGDMFISKLSSDLLIIDWVNDKTKNQLELHIYPNPATDYVCIDFSDKNTPFTYSVFDIMGREILKGSQETTGKAIINTSQLSSGLYFITVEVAGHQNNAALSIVR